MLCKKRKITYLEKFIRVKYVCPRCLACKVYNSSAYHCCSSVELSVHCDNINKSHYFNYGYWIYVV